LLGACSSSSSDSSPTPPGAATWDNARWDDPRTTWAQ
jgi:hypothetical protein